jgi:plasmid stability protein
MSFPGSRSAWRSREKPCDREAIFVIEQSESCAAGAVICHFFLMSNLTISIDDSLIRKARVRAIQEGTSVSARIREFLTVYAEGGDRQQAAAQNFVAAARRSKANRDGATWGRADAYERAYPSARIDQAVTPAS